MAVLPAAAEGLDEADAVHKALGRDLGGMDGRGLKVEAKDQLDAVVELASSAKTRSVRAPRMRVAVIMWRGG